MIIEGRMVATVLFYVFTFIGYLLGKEIALEESEIKLKQKRLELLEAALNAIKKEGQKQ